jgi:hypothetical protein
MITGFFLQTFYIVITFMVGLLPTIALPAAFLSALSLAVGYLNAFSFLLPVGSLLTVIGFAITFHLALLTFDFTLWVIHLLRGR